MGDDLSDESDKSLSDEATFARQSPARRPDASLSDERTLGGRDAAGLDAVIDGIDVVDLQARYTIEGTLGKGGMGAVLLATDTRLDRKVAIKRILGEAARSQTAIQRFLTEAKAIAALNHPNIVQIYDYGRAKDGPFLIMEYVDGGSLAEKCKAGPIPLDEAINLACQLCDGLAKAHDVGIIHRDIKPANVLLSKDGLPKLTDFGLAKAEANDHGMTMTGAVMGTPDFMPPEQRRDASEVDARSDLWSLAATVYQMVSGRSPKIIRFDQVPASLTGVFGKALEDDKAARFQTAREFRDALTASQSNANYSAKKLVEGECPACHAMNESTRRYCRGCGGTLEIPCLACGEAMLHWDAICGACGGQQPEILATRKAAIADIQSAAEAHLAVEDFDEAMRTAQELTVNPHPALRDAADWAALFLERVSTRKAEQEHLAVSRLTEARVHEDASDYLSGVMALALVPESLRTRLLPGATETVERASRRLQEKQDEVHKTEALVRQRVAERAFDGLLPHAARLLELCPHRQDVKRVVTQLRKREKVQQSMRGNAIQQAKQMLADGRFDEALEKLAGLGVGEDDPATNQLRSQALAARRKLQELRVRIQGLLPGGFSEELEDAVSDLLTVAPKDQAALGIQTRLNEQKRQLAAEEEATVAEAKQMITRADYIAAADALRGRLEQKWSSRVEELLADVNRISEARERALDSLDDAIEKGAGEPTASLAYAGLVASRSIEDSVFESKRQQRARAVVGARARSSVDATFKIILGAMGGAACASVFVVMFGDLSSFFGMSASTAASVRIAVLIFTPGLMTFALKIWASR